MMQELIAGETFSVSSARSVLLQDAWTKFGANRKELRKYDLDLALLKDLAARHNHASRCVPTALETLRAARDGIEGIKGRSKGRSLKLTPTTAQPKSAMAKPSAKRKRPNSAPPSPERPAQKVRKSNTSPHVIKDSEDGTESNREGDEEEDQEDVRKSYARLQADRLVEGSIKKVRVLFQFQITAGTHSLHPSLIGNTNTEVTTSVRSHVHERDLKNRQ